MHFELVTLISLLSIPLATAQDLSTLAQIPQCAQEPAKDTFVSSGCALTDVKCLCSNNAFQSQLKKEIIQDCSYDDQVKMLKFATTFCEKAGVTLNIPEAGTLNPGSPKAAPSTPPPAPASSPPPAPQTSTPPSSPPSSPSPSSSSVNSTCPSNAACTPASTCPAPVTITSYVTVTGGAGGAGSPAGPSPSAGAPGPVGNSSSPTSESNPNSPIQPGQSSAGANTPPPPTGTGPAAFRGGAGRMDVSLGAMLAGVAMIGGWVALL